MKPSVSCEEMELRMMDALKGDAAAQTEVLGHTQHCLICRTEWEALQTTWMDLGQLSKEQPSPSMRASFYRDLESEKASARPTGNGHRLSKWLNHPVLQVAAVVLLVVGGFALGLRSGMQRMDGSFPTERAMLVRGTLRDRMTGLALISQSRHPDPSLASTLMDLVDRDPDVQVRLMAVEALYLFDDQPGVRDRLVKSLARQTSPEVQRALVDLIASLREKRATDALKKLLREAPSPTPRTSQDL